MVDVSFKPWGMIKETSEINNARGPVTVTVTGPTSVCGDITNDTIWPSLGSPFVVTCDITVKAGVTLTIEPGSVVSFATGTRLLVQGTLVADTEPASQAIMLSDAGHPWGLALDTSRNRVLVAQTHDNSLAVVSTLNNTMIQTVPVGGGPVDVVLDNNRNHLYVSQGDGHVRVLDPATYAVQVDLNLLAEGGATGMDVDPVSGNVFVASPGTNSVTVLSGDALTSTPHLIPVGCWPRDLVYNSKTRTSTSLITATRQYP